MIIRQETERDFEEVYSVVKAAFETAERSDGNALIKEGHRIAKELGYGYSVVLGSEKYYPRFGYIPAEHMGIRVPFEVPAENFMAVKLREDAAAAGGAVKYAAEFGI